MSKIFMKQYHAIGLMSGTSFDGLDIVYCSFEHKKHWGFKIIHSECVKYSKTWISKILNAKDLNAKDFLILNKEYGHYLGEKVNFFIKKHKITELNCISSHGHTIFHEPNNGLTFQLGCGAAIASTTNKKVISDFRKFDVSIGGQGAPLVPFGDELLFNNYSYCLNLGGIANISYSEKETRIGGDLTFANMASNFLAQKMGSDFDNNGEIAASGTVNNELLSQLNSNAFFKKQMPKSLAREDFENWFSTIFQANKQITVPDQLATLGLHLTNTISNAITKNKRDVLITGGGAHNKYWINLLKNKYNIECILPSKEIINFKEALIFAFLGLIRLERKTNILSSVTGASRDNIGGIIHFG